jgi:lipoprotein signal peptidase
MWIGGLLTLMILSFLYKDNAFYKFAEHLFVGVSAAYWMVVGFWTTLIPNLVARLWPSHMGGILPSATANRPEWMYVIPLVFGILMLARLSPKAAWLSRWAMAFVIGFAAGTNFTRYLQSDFVSQINSSITSVYQPGLSVMGTVGDVFSKIVIVAGLLGSLIYFYFSKEHKGAFGRAARFGIWVLMAAFGATFGYTVMARVSLLTGRMDFLIKWIGGIFS